MKDEVKAKLALVYPPRRASGGLILFSLDDEEHVLRLDSIMPNERKGLSGTHLKKSQRRVIWLIPNLSAV